MTNLVREQEKLERYENTVLPHLDAAHNLARWLTRNEHDAEDVVQEACLRAFRFLDSYRGGDARCWLLAIVRNSCYTWLRRNRPQELVNLEDEDIHTPDGSTRDPESALLRSIDSRMLRQALEELSLPLREVIVMRELEEMSYREIAASAGLPVGTVMSRLARARRQLQVLLDPAGKEASDGVR